LYIALAKEFGAPIATEDKDTEDVAQTIILSLKLSSIGERIRTSVEDLTLSLS